MKDWEFILEYNSVTKTLENNPAGWGDFTIMFDRSPTYHSVLRTISESLRYQSTFNDNGGYDFINDAYEADGIKAIVTLTINKRNYKTNRFEFFYGGILNYRPGKWKRNVTEREFEIGTEDSEKLQAFAANEEVEIDLNSTTSLNGTAITAFSNSPKPTTFKSIDLYLKSQTDGQFSGSDSTTLVNLDIATNYNGNLSLNEIGDRLTVNFPAVDENLYINSISSPEQNADFYSTVISGSIQDFITIEGAATSALWTHVKTMVFTVYDGDGIFQEWLRQEIFRQTGTGNETSTKLTGDYSFSFNPLTVVPNGYITLQVETRLTSVSTSKSASTRTTVDNAIFFELTDGANDYGVDVYLPHEAFDRGIQLITNETDTSKLCYSEKFGRTDSEFTSYPVDGDAAYYSYNIGWNIRDYPDKPFLTTFKNMFKSYDSIFNLALIHDRDNDSFIIENKKEAYKNIEILRIENISEVTITPSNEWYFKQILSGYPKITFEDFQGVNEINLESEHYFDMPVKTKYDIRSVASASSVAIELARRKRYRTNASEDTKYDELNYIVEVFQNGLLLETVQGATSLTAWEGAEQYYNWSITPRENVWRWLPFIGAGRFKDATLDIIKTKYQKETNAEYRRITGELVEEFDDLTFQSVATKLVIHPEIINFKGLFTKEVIDQLNLDPHGYITGVDDNGIEYSGFIESVEGNPSKGEAEYTLIRANI